MKWLIALLLLVRVVRGDLLAKELESSLDRALQCRHRDPPSSPVIALTPNRFAQVLAVIRNGSQSTGCVQPQINAPFAAEDPRTWKYCLFGTCSWDRCNCLPSYFGPNCALFSKKCWMLYCFLTSCHPMVKTIFCKCDPRYYGAQVTSGEYWYDDGKRYVFYPPPPNWSDDAEFPKVEEFDQTILDIPDLNDPILGELGIEGLGDSKATAKSQTHWKDPDLRPTPGHRQKDGPKKKTLKNYQISKVEYADEKPNDSKTSNEKEDEDIKEVMTEVAKKASSSTALAHSWTIILVTAFNLFIAM